MVVFSELAALGPSPRRAQRLPGPAEDEFREMALQHDIWLLPGTLFEKKDDRVFNTASVINPKGEVVGRFRKLFPFRPYELDVEAGDEFLVFDVPDVGRFGVSICYDMWFPETSRTLAAMGRNHPAPHDDADDRPGSGAGYRPRHSGAATVLFLRRKRGGRRWQRPLDHHRAVR
ncbi:MAG: carbon-nitrogen hydrolase family protein [Bryobacterales bacterium]